MIKERNNQCDFYFYWGSSSKKQQNEKWNHLEGNLSHNSGGKWVK